MGIERHCELCGAVLVGQQKRYCRICSGEQRRHSRSCEVCGALIEAPVGGQKYCSDKCAAKAHYQRKKMRRGGFGPVTKSTSSSASVCDRAGGRKCAYWRPLYSAENKNLYCCHYLLETGRSNGWESPCGKFLPGSGKNRPDSHGLFVPDVETETDQYERENAFKRY